MERGLKVGMEILVQKADSCSFRYRSNYRCKCESTMKNLWCKYEVKFFTGLFCHHSKQPLFTFLFIWLLTTFNILFHIFSIITLSTKPTCCYKKCFSSFYKLI